MYVKAKTTVGHSFMCIFSHTSLVKQISFYIMHACTEIRNFYLRLTFEILS